MDPNALLVDMLDDARGVIDRDNATGTEDAGHVALAQKVIYMHDWIIRGGFLPAAWVHSLETKDGLDDDYVAPPALGSMRHQIPVRRDPEPPKWHQEMS